MIRLEALLNRWTRRQIARSDSVQPDVAWLPCGAALDAESVDALRPGAEQALRGPAPTLIADLSAVRSVDTAGLGFLVEYAQRASCFGKTIRVHAPAPCVAHLMQRAGIAHLFEYHPEASASRLAADSSKAVAASLDRQNEMAWS